MKGLVAQYSFHDAAVKEESGGAYRNLRRSLTLVSIAGGQP